jgi:hypothetical protein
MNKKEMMTEFGSLAEAAQAFFTQADEYLKANPKLYEFGGGRTRTLEVTANEAWGRLPESLHEAAQMLQKRVAILGVAFCDGVKSSPLLVTADDLDIRIGFRAMASASVLRSYNYHDPYAISEEDRVYGIVPASQSESNVLPNEARAEFLKTGQALAEKLELLLPSDENLTKAIVATEAPDVRSYRPNTAFIMMQINNELPKLEDVKNTIKEVFKAFGIRALRSDEIEHQDVITQRILDEIATSEFLVADLTGARPSVYYEVGYAHALKRRPILYREKGTSLHFDLMVHNVPKYENITDLKKKLATRLVALTGKEPSQ